jgi:Protein of unknown function (DUF2442)
MNSLATNQIEIRATSVRVSDDALVVDLSDGRTVLAPLAWYPRLLHGTAAERNDHQLIGEGLGIHWPQLSKGFSPDANGMRARSRLISGSPRGRVLLNVDFDQDKSISGLMRRSIGSPVR